MPGANFKEGLQNGAKQAVCDFFDKTVDAANWFYDKTHPLWLPDRDRLPNDGKVWGGVQGLLCGDVPEDPIPPPAAPFDGGQCAGIEYRVVVSAEVVRNSDGAVIGDRDDIVFVAFGPITSIEGVNVNVSSRDSRQGVFATANGFVTSFNSSARKPVEAEGKVAASGGRSSPLGSQATGYIGISGGGGPRDFTTNILDVDVTRTDGLPDECGSPPPPPPPPPTPGSNIINIDIDYNNGGDTNIVVPVAFAIGYATVSIDGRLTIPIDMRGANFSLFGSLDVNTGDINFNFDGGSPGNEACCQPPDIEEPPPEEVDPPEDPEEDESVIIGVVVTATSVASSSKTTRVFQEGATTIYHPRLGNVYFRIKIGESTVWTGDIPVRVRQQYIVCPTDFGAVNVIGVPAPGVEWTLSPIRRRIVESEFPE